MPTESKIWLLLILFGMLIGIGYAAHYLTSVDNANFAMLEQKQRLDSVKEMVETRRKNWEKLEGLATKNRELAAHHEVLLKAKEVLETRYRKVTSEIKYAAESIKNAVDKARSNGPGTEFGEVTLANGKVLRNAKVRAVEADSVSFIHADGIGSIGLELLPAEIKERYDLGPEALVPQLEQARDLVLAVPPPAKKGR
ncbi:MAG: hypothetical protein ACO1TE_28845 [Prosthecobacter sp.]